MKSTGWVKKTEEELEMFNSKEVPHRILGFFGKILVLLFEPSGATTGLPRTPPTPQYAVACIKCDRMEVSYERIESRVCECGAMMYDTDLLKWVEPETPTDQALSAARQMADTHYTRGVDAYDKNNYAAALAEFDQALQLKPDHADAYLYRGLTHYAKQNNKLALADLDAALSFTLHAAEIYYWRGCVYADLGDRPKAIFALENALRGDLESELRREAMALIEQLQHSPDE